MRLRGVCTWLLCLAAFEILVVGCAGNSEADFRARSRRRDDDEEESAEVVAPQAVPPARGAASAETVPNNAASIPPTDANAEQADTPDVASVPVPSDLEGLSIPNQPPAKPYTEQERWGRSVQNLARIASAIRNYCEERGTLPGTSLGMQGQLSWRVELLPYLGYDTLYAKFDKKAAWNSPQNLRLLSFIPPEFQSPERFDQKTNYLLSAGPYACCQKPVKLEDLTDGTANTLLILEANNALAVPWTQPQDYEFDPENVANQLGNLRNGTLVMLANNELRHVPRTAPVELWVALFRPASQDRIDAMTTLRPVAPDRLPEDAPVSIVRFPVEVPDDDGENPPMTVASVPKVTVTAPADPIPSGTIGVEQSQLPDVLSQFLPPESRQQSDLREPVPDAEDQKIVGETLRTLYKKEYEDARVSGTLNKFSQKLLEETARMADDLRATYVLNDMIRKLAIASGDVPTAMAAVRNVEQRFQLDGPKLRYETLESLSERVLRAGEMNSELGKQAEELTQTAISSNNFDLATQANELVKLAAKKALDKKYIELSTSRRQELEVSRQMYGEVVSAAKTLQQQPQDPLANQTVGIYLALVQGDFANGLSFLANGEDVRWKLIASIDLELNRTPANTAALADQWWSIGETLKNPLRRNAQLRAVHWYQDAVPQMQNNLQRVAAENRLREAEKLYPQIADTAKPTYSDE